MGRQRQEANGPIQNPSKHGACNLVDALFSSTEKAYDSVDAAGPCQAPKAQSGSGIVRLSLASLISFKPLENTNFDGCEPVTC